MRFREVYDDPEQHIENLPYENQAGGTEETVSFSGRRRKSSDDYSRDGRFNDLEGILKRFLGQTFEERTNNLLFESERVLAHVEAEIKDNIKYDTKWYELDSLMRQVKDEIAKQQQPQESEIGSKKGKDDTYSSVSESTESSTQKPAKPDLPSWDLANWGMTREQVNNTPVTTKQPDIREVLAEREGDVFTAGEVLKIQDRELVQKILGQQGIDVWAKVDVFVVETKDIEDSRCNGCTVYMMDKKRKNKES